MINNFLLHLTDFIKYIAPHPLFLNEQYQVECEEQLKFNEKYMPVLHFI